MADALVNWGAYWRDQENPTPAEVPAGGVIYQQIITAYRESHASDPYDVEAAEHTERQIVAARLGKRQRYVLVMRYVMALPTRRAAGLLSRMGFECSHTTYRAWVADTVALLADRVAKAA